MIKRSISSTLKKYANTFRAVALLGPRQSGKTTLVKAVFPNKPYVSFEDSDIREYAQSDPRSFLNQYNDGAIFDEIQRVPDLMNYLQGVIDESNKKGMFILTGSHNLLLHSQISQSLAGRVGVLSLLPLSLEETNGGKHENKSLNQQLLKGMYPRIYNENLDPDLWYKAYIDTYVERDIRLIKNVHDLSQFQKFVKMCAGRTGQLLNLSELGSAVGISSNTAEAWISILEASYIIFRLKTHHKNFNKRLVKSPKLYFYDTGLLCSLLSITSEKELHSHYLRGGIMESFVISELIKNRYNKGDKNNIYFWRDKSGHELDVLIEQKQSLIPIEVKSAQTFNTDFLKGIKYWQKLSGAEDKAFVIYDGTEQKRPLVEVINWKTLHKL